MTRSPSATIAIVDYGFGNLRSVALACEHVGLQPRITADPGLVESADAVVLPGIGAFGDAMEALRRLRLADVLRRVAESRKPLMGICLGAQLLLDDSTEFGCHEGLGIVAGSVQELPRRARTGARLKVPHVGWTSIEPARQWTGTSLDGVPAGKPQYFTHSFYLDPRDGAIVLSTSTHGDFRFCSSYELGNVFGCQWHPERSGESGLVVYENLLRACVRAQAGEVIDAK